MRNLIRRSVSSDSKAFTLVELLVVIAIIALLAAILFPVFASAREKARQTACLSNEKQIGLAVMQYDQDFDDSFPCGQPTGGGWAGQILPYLKSTQVLACPDDTNPEVNYRVAYQRISYGYNFTFTASGNQVNNVSVGGVILAKLNNPALTVLFCEIQNDFAPLNSAPANENFSALVNCTDNVNNAPCVPSGWGGAYYATGCTAGRTCSEAPMFPNGVHLNGSNYISADGHCKWLPPSKVSMGRAGNGSEQGDAQTSDDPETDYSDNSNGPRPTGTDCMDVFWDTGCTHPNSATLTFSKL